MPLLSTITRFARSRQGRMLAQQAMNYARSPEGKRKISQAREVAARRTKPRPR